MLQEGFSAFSVTTNDTTPTVLANIPVPTGEVSIINAYIIARRTDGTVFAGMVVGAAQNDTGTPALVGAMANTLRVLDGLLGGLLGLDEPQVEFVPVAGGIDITVTQPSGNPVVWEAIAELRRTGS